MRLWNLFAVLLLSVSYLAATASFNLLQSLDSRKLSEVQTSNASVFRDPDSGALTLTFRYAAGEPEVRIPVAVMGWPTDWSPYKAIQYNFYASSLETVSIGFSDGSKTKYFVTEPLSGIRIKGVIPFDAFVQTRTMTPLTPLGYKVWPNRLFTFEKVKELVFKMRYPNQSSQLTLYNFTLVPEVPRDDILDKKPLIDRYGQWIPENWPGKAHSEEELRQLWEKDQLSPIDYGYCLIGGDISRNLSASGYFRVQKVEGKWVFVDPHGHPFYSTGMDLVGYDPSSFATDIQQREFLFQDLPPAGPAWSTAGKVVSFYVANIMRRFGEGWREKWTRHTIDRLRNWGFNTIANWSDREIAVSSGMPYVLPLSGWTTRKVFPFPYDFPDVFSQEFASNVDAAAKRQCEPLKDDANLIGWFVGNEPHWARTFGALQSWPDMLLADPESSATQNKLKELLAANPGQEQKIKEEFLYTCAKQYFDTIAQAIRKYDPNHLILGIRFAERPNDRWAELSRVFDVFSINIYSAEFRPDAEMVKHYSEVSGKPILIGEFTACTPGRGLQGLFYNTHKVRDHAERGQAYRYYVENAAASPYIVGTHWFQMVDDLPTGRPSDEERLNYGFINVIDLPYAELVKASQETFQKIYDLKFGKAAPTQKAPRYN